MRCTDRLVVALCLALAAPCACGSPRLRGAEPAVLVPAGRLVGAAAPAGAQGGAPGGAWPRRVAAQAAAAGGRSERRRLQGSGQQMNGHLGPKTCSEPNGP